MEEQLKHIKPGTTLLLHACCAPCSSAVLETLGNIFQITIFFYNPNITDKDEYEKRLAELKRFISEIKIAYPIKLVAGPYEPNKYLSMAKGLEEEPEGGSRCFKCYELRLLETAKVAEKLAIEYFTTTLSISPYKNANWLNTIGEDVAKTYHVKYLYADFKKKNGYKRSITLSEKYHLYRQNYCGCLYSKKARELKESKEIG